MARLDIKFQIQQLIDKVYNLVEEIMDGNVPAMVTRNNLNALCLAAHFDKFVCGNHLRSFRRVSNIIINEV